MATVKRGARSASLAATTDVIVVGGTPYAVGLLWQSASKPKGFMREVKAFTKQYRLRQFVIREGAMTQIGYVVTAPGARPIRKAQALVPTLADQLGASWLAVFRVTEVTFVMGGVHNGAIRPDADMIGSEEDVRARFLELLTLQWGRVIAPKSFLASAEPLGLDSLLSPEALKTSRSARGKSYPIRSNGPDLGRRELFLYGGTAAIALIGSLIQHQVTVARQEEEDRQAAVAAARETANLERERKAAIEQVKAMAPVPQWPNEPEAKKVLSRCMGSILAENRVPQVIEGWRFQSASCNGDRLSVTYGRTPGASEDMFLAVARKSFPFVSATPEVGTASGPVTTDEAFPARGEVTLLSSEQTELLWNSHFHRLNVMTLPQLTKKGDPPKKPPAPTLVKLIGEARAQVPDPWWAEYSFSVTSSFPIDQVMEPLLGPGLVISEVNLTTGASGPSGNNQQAGLQWTINGVMYAKK